MINLKTLLTEGFAWERKDGKGLPTLSEVQEEYNRKLKETHNAKPDFRDVDGDDNEKESWIQAEKDKLKEGRNDHGILDLVSEAEDLVQNLRNSMSTNSVLQRTEKMGYLSAYDELLDVLSEIGLQAERDM